MANPADATPLSIGLETEDGAYTRLIERGTPIPAMASHVVALSAATRRSIAIFICQGEAKVAGKNARLVVCGISGFRAQSAEIKVMLAIDANGILRVTAATCGSAMPLNVELRTVGRGMSKSRNRRTTGLVGVIRP